jgi:hypothetical protein
MNAPTSFNTPIHPDGGYSDVAALLTILTDPAKHKQRLDELLAQENAAKEQIATLNEMAADTRRMHSAAEAANIVSNNRKTALDAREAELDERAKRIERSETRKSDEALQRRENAVTVRENLVTQEEARIAVSRADLDEKHSKIKFLATGLT